MISPKESHKIIVRLLPAAASIDGLSILHRAISSPFHTDFLETEPTPDFFNQDPLFHISHLLGCKSGQSVQTYVSRNLHASLSHRKSTYTEASCEQSTNLLDANSRLLATSPLHVFQHESALIYLPSHKHI